ncbi:endonuclease [Pedobacter lusitanus]|uniref:Endonuclease n=1 Tax=Pedobacter lusitanus TaxID=1503925 RepID=A0A0D0GK61_9SPHI|nr:DNA/RNA non-specific endonuclease [Pedobacter lusitanus]KIO77637.1 endonuclease [Pedobacter lusitanus]
MIFRRLLIYSSLALVLAGCSKKTTEDTIITDPIVPPAVYSINEGFESSNKAPYAVGNITSPTGSWTLDDALVGATDADLKNGTRSIRLRTGKVSMNFDIKGMTMLYIKHGKYGKDAASAWQLMISTDAGVTYTQVGTDVVEDNAVLKLDSFKVTATTPVRFQIKKSGTARINIDDITFKGTGDSGIIIGTPDTNPVDTANNITAAPPRGITVGTDAQPASGDNSNLLFGNPSNATMVSADNFLINQSYYVESYNSTKGTPNWVSWHLDVNDFNGTSPRLDNFAGFTGLPSGAFQVQSNTYVGSGFDRGHNIPSADRTSSSNANSATFLMSNMIPQAPLNNQKTWANMENYLRTLASQGNEVYIIMGSYGSGGVGSKGLASTIANGKVTVPSNVWKIAVVIPAGNGDLDRVTATTRVIAVDTPNIQDIKEDWKNYRVSVRQIEKATGYDLLSSLPKNIQDAIETTVDKAN